MSRKKTPSRKSGCKKGRKNASSKAGACPGGPADQEKKREKIERRTVTIVRRSESEGLHQKVSHGEKGVERGEQQNISEGEGVEYSSSYLNWEHSNAQCGGSAAKKVGLRTALPQKQAPSSKWGRKGKKPLPLWKQATERASQITR